MKLENVIGKPIFYIDRNKAFRICKAISINGNRITVQDAVGGKEVIHPEMNKIFGVVVKSKVPGCTSYEPIEYGIIRIGRRIKNKKAHNEIIKTQIKPLKMKRRIRGRPRKVE